MKKIFFLLLLFLPNLVQADFIEGANLANEGKFKEANIEFQKGIDKGEAKSYFGLGSAYYFGDGVEIDLKKAFEIFEQGAEKNNGESAFILAMMYLRGEFVEINAQKYLHYIKQSANACIPQAQEELGYLFMDSTLVETNNVEAAAWFLTAFWMDGNDNLPLGSLLDKMTPEERSKAIGRQKEIIAENACETMRD